MNVEPIKHADTTMAVAMRIEAANPKMQVREFVMNAMEAATQSKRPRVRIDAIDIDGVRKLAILNSGPGMDADKLRRVMDLHSSGDEKTQGVSGNFGIGAKIAGLRANPYGLRYRSCCNGRVSEAWLRRFQDAERTIYGLEQFECVDGKWHTIIDVTEECEIEGYSLSSDWTEVVLLGKDAKQDTFADPEGTVDANKHWLFKEIASRFYGLPVPVYANTGEMYQDKDKFDKCSGLNSVQQRENWNELVELADGASLRYSILKSTKTVNSVQLPIRGHIALVYRNEIYDITYGHNWSDLSIRYGIHTASGRISVQIHLPDEYPVYPTMSRENLKLKDDGSTVNCESFRNLVISNMPQHLVEFMEHARKPQVANSEWCDKQLQSYIDLHKWRQEWLKKDAGGEISSSVTHAETGTDGSDGIGEKHRPAGKKPKAAVGHNSQGPQPAAQRGELGAQAPGWIWTSEDDGTEFNGRPAFYRSHDHTVVFDIKSNQFRMALDMVMQFFPHMQDSRNYRDQLHMQMQEAFQVQVGMHILAALNHHGEKTWSVANVESTLTREVLCVLLDQTADIVDKVKRRNKKHLQLEK